MKTAILLKQKEHSGGGEEDLSPTKTRDEAPSI